MSQSRNNFIDALFRNELTMGKAHRDFVDQEWQTMEALLEENKVRRSPIVWLYPLAVGIAAIFFLFFGWQYLWSPNLTNANMSQVAMCREQNFTKKRNQSTYNSNSIIAPEINPSQAKNKGINKHITTADLNKVSGLKSSSKSRDTIILLTSIIPEILQGVKLDSSIQFAKLSHDLLPVMAATKSPPSGLMSSHPRLSLAILAAPDVNGVNSFKSSETGKSFSLQLSFLFNKKLSITSGASYSVKPYQTSFANYRSSNPNWWMMNFGSQTKPDNVMANCQVLDIPININYSLYKHNGNELHLGAGISSYFMLRENYQFDFANSSTAPSSLQVNNQNQHFFGVINLNATYERRVNSNLNLVLQPFAKLPITGIGFGQVNLKSAGIAAGFSWNLKAF